MFYRRKLFGKKSKRKSTATKSDAIFVKNRNTVKLQVDENHEEHVEGTETTQKQISDQRSKLTKTPAKDDATYNDFAEDFYDKIDTQLDVIEAKSQEKIYYTPHMLYTQKYDHLTSFVNEQRNKDAYDVLMRDPCYPELLKKSKSHLDLRENNNYLISSNTQTTDTTSGSAVPSTRNKTFVRRKDDNRVDVKLHPPSRKAVTKSSTICGQRNVTRRGQYIRTRAGRAILPLEPRMKKITIAESYIRATNNSNTKANRTESQVSRSHVEALRAQFDEKSSSGRDATPRKQTTRAPFSLPVKSPRNSAEAKCELAESYLFNAMKSKIAPQGGLDNDCCI